MSSESSSAGRTVRYVRLERTDTKEYVQKYIRERLRKDLKKAGPEWRMLILQLWSALHPDPCAPPTRPIADVCRYMQFLVGLAASGRFRAPPRVALVRRDNARIARREAAAANRRQLQKASITRTVDGAAELAKIMATLGATAGTVRRIGG